MEKVEITIQELDGDINFTIVRHQKHSSDREKVFCDGWTKLVESIILTSQTLSKEYNAMENSVPKIDLIDAVIAWTTKKDSIDGIPKLKVFKRLEQIIPQEYINTDGASWSDWQDGHNDFRVDWLMNIVEQLKKDGFTPDDVHEAFMEINEYHQTFTIFGLKGIKKQIQ